MRDVTGGLSPPLDLTAFVDLACRDDVQLFTPALDANGEPRLQAGESVVTTFDTIGAGIRSRLSPVRHAGGSMEEMDGRCYVTTTRLVFVCHRWQLGGDLSSARRCVQGVIEHRSGQAGTPVGQLLGLGPRLLVGQVRWPWLAEVVYSRAAGHLDGLVELRCVQSGTKRNTSMFLSLVPASVVDVDEIARSVVHAARDDRLGHHCLRPDKAAQLRDVDVPPASCCATTVGLPGAYKRMASTAANGGHSAVSLALCQERLVDRIGA